MTGEPEVVIQVQNLRKTYGKIVAVDDVSFEVRRGEIFGFLGPNGAGKTTTMECVEGHRKADGGVIRVLGMDPLKEGRVLQQRIGVQHQEAQLQKRIKVWEAVDLWSTLYRRVADPDVILEQLGLSAKRDAWFMTLSGGQKQRLFIALAIIHDPEIVFLDELTTGLDPQARRAIWSLVLGIKERGKTVFLTTHLMEEAERLCDRVAILEHGRVIETGTPADLVSKHCPQRGVVFSAESEQVEEAMRTVPHLKKLEREDSVYTLTGEGDDFVTDIMGAIAEHRVRVRDFRTEIPTLEDVFLKLTGHTIRD
jgi:ABC-2 type transport system ATP-binding protein